VVVRGVTGIPSPFPPHKGKGGVVYLRIFCAPPLGSLCYTMVHFTTLWFTLLHYGSLCYTMVTPGLDSRAPCGIVS
jgi:hypothetical protein